MSHRKDNRLIESARGSIPKKVMKANRPPEGEAWAWLTIKMLSSPAMRSLSNAARQVLDRLMIEHMAHAGTENGNLICTHTNLAEHGVRYPSIAPAIRELEFMGWIKVTKGYAFKGEHVPSKYRLTWLPVREGQSAIPATNEWKAITDQHVATWKSQKSHEAKTKIEITKQRKASKAGVSGNVIPLKRSGGVANV